MHDTDPDLDLQPALRLVDRHVERRPDAEPAPEAQRLAEFFDAVGLERAPRTRARYARVHRRLEQFLDEVDVTRSLGTDAAAALAAARDVGRHGAFWRMLGLDDLVCCLPLFVEPPWLPEHPGERRTHLALVERLLRYLRLHGLLHERMVACAWFDARDAVRRARQEGRSAAEVPIFDPWGPGARWP